MCGAACAGAQAADFCGLGAVPGTGLETKSEVNVLGIRLLARAPAYAWLAGPRSSLRTACGWWSRWSPRFQGESSAGRRGGGVWGSGGGGGDVWLSCVQRTNA